MQSTGNDLNTHFKLAQLWHIVKSRDDKCDALKSIINKIFTDDVNINQKITIDVSDFLSGSNSIHLKDCTALHFFYWCSCNIKIFNDLLDRGADFTLKNGNGQTVLQLIITRERFMWSEKFPFIKSVLSAHVKYQNSVNPHDNNGISHLHGACMTNHVEALELFLDNGMTIDEAVNMDSNQFAGYTPLHFAANFHSVEVAQILVNRGANVNAKNAGGNTALDVLINHRLGTLDYLNKQAADNISDYTKDCMVKLSDTEKIIRLLMMKQCIPTNGLSSFQATCTLKDLKIAEQLLDEDADINYIVPITSNDRPGYTAVHFAANNSIQAVELLLRHGAMLNNEAASGLTAFDICINSYSIQDIHDVLRLTGTWNEMYLCDEKTNLLDVLLSTKDVHEFRLFLRNENVKYIRIPSISTLWPGSTILHLAIMFSTCKDHGNYHRQKIYDDNIVKECMDNNFDVNTINAKSQTPIHLAFRLEKENIVKLLLEHLNTLDEISNLADEDNLTYLHIGCAMKDEAIVEKLLRNSSPNVVFNGKKSLAYTGFDITNKERIISGSTPLHIVASNGAPVIAEMLLRNGANLHAIDSNGYAPIHCLFKHYPYYMFDMNEIPIIEAIRNVLFNSLSEDPKDQIVDGKKLSYLHIACILNHVDAAEKLLDLGTNVNEMYSMGSPLQLATLKPEGQMISLLIRRGADVFAKVPKSLYGLLYISIPLENGDLLRYFMPILWKTPDLQKQVEERIGLTRLHIACYMRNEEALKTALNEEIDVNAQIKADSEIYSGFTGLHLVMNLYRPQLFNQTYDVYALIKLLIEHGGDVTIRNNQKNTPVHMLFEEERYFNDVEGCKDLLLNAPQNFDSNPADNKGMSHFHLACHWHKVDVVKRFLQNGSVNVNQRTDLWSGYNTPLHLVFDHEMGPHRNWIRLLETVDLLLEYGADVNAKDIHGDTPLHRRAVLRSPGMTVLDKLIRHGADVKIKNISGQTFFDKCPLDSEINYSNIFEKCGYQTTGWNFLTGEGNIAKIFVSSHRNIATSPEFKQLLESSDVKIVDKLGRTVIHNSVAFASNSFYYVNQNSPENYFYAIKSFIERGIDIDGQDKSGRTALHYAVRMNNETGVITLLKFGADINIIDSSEKSALSYVMEFSKDSIRFDNFQYTAQTFNLHIKKLLYLGLEINQSDKNILNELRTFVCKTRYGFGPPLQEDSSGTMPLFFSQVDKSKTMNIGVGSLTLFNFLNETGAVRFYSYMSMFERTTIDEYFKSIAYDELDKLEGIIKLQFRKMKARSVLIDSALLSIRELLGFSVPGLCEEIARLLTNSELINLIQSTTLNVTKSTKSEDLAHGISTLSCC